MLSLLAKGGGGDYFYSFSLDSIGNKVAYCLCALRIGTVRHFVPNRVLAVLELTCDFSPVRLRRCSSFSRGRRLWALVGRVWPIECMSIREEHTRARAGIGESERDNSLSKYFLVFFFLSFLHVSSSHPPSNLGAKSLL